MGDKKETYFHISEQIDKTFLAGLSHEKLNERLKEAYLGIIVNHDTIANPLMDIPFVAQENFNEYLVYLMSRPEYFYFIIKVLFGMKSFPLQCLILKELYDHRFPILLGSRGLAKSTAIALYCLIRLIITPGIKCVITGAGFRQAKIVFEMMERIWEMSPMLRNCFKGGRNGPTHGTDAWSFRLGDSICWALPVGHDGQKVRGFRSNLLFCVDRNTLVQTDTGLVKIVDYMKYDCDKLLNMDGSLERPSNIIKTQKTDVYEITTINGYSIKCSSMHRLLVTDGKKTSWKVAKDLTTNDYLELDTNDYFPERYVEKDGLVVDEELGYLIGLLVSEGTITNRNFIEITHTNKDLIDEIVAKFPNFNWKIYEREATVDNRGWDCKKSYSLKFCNTEFRELLKSLGLDYVSALDKEIPWCILQSPESVVQSFLKGLFIGDGSCFKYTARGKVNVGVTYYSSSIELAKQLQILLLKFNITSGLNKRMSKLSTNPNYMLAMRGVQAFKMFSLIENPYWENYYKEGHLAKRSFKARKHGNSFVAETTRCDKNVYIGSYKTEDEASNAIQKYLEDARPAVKVKSVTKLDYQDILYDFTMPESHSFCAGGFINHNCDEFASLPRSIFEEVMSGFLTVSAEPVEQIQHRATIRAKKILGIPVDIMDYETNIIQNQLVLSGTAYYKHNHFYEYFSKWRDIINSGGDNEKLNAIFSDAEENRNWKHYSIIRIPVDLIPEGFMDMDQINRIKASVNKDVFLREYLSCFSDDSDGFFKRSLIEFCTLSSSNKIVKDGQEVKFNPVLFGDKNKKYVYGVDPAYQGDNFAIVILEINESHRRVVHCWTTQASDHKQMLKDFREGKSTVNVENQYYDYCARKIRTLMKRFPCAYIALDAQGGGYPIMEALMDPSKLQPGEELILPVINTEEKPQETDLMQGDHIIQIYKNTSENISDANHALKKDMESRDIIFPYHDSLSYVESEFYDASLGQSSVLYDTLEDCIADIEELKNELSTITISETRTGKENFDTPETKGANAKKGRLRKDRYSALLMANWVARSAENLVTRQLNSSDVMTLGNYVDKANPDAMFIGNSKLTQRLNDLYS
jgi:intein/homing endonuclease